MIRLRPFHAALLALVGLAAAQSPSLKNLNLRGGRFRPLTYEEMTPAQKTMIDHLLSGERGGTGGPFNVTLRSPEMGDIAQNLGAYLRYHSSLPRKLNEFAIVITGRIWKSQYEFYAHSPLAIQAGMSPAIIEAVAAGKRPTGMQPDEEAIYNFCTELQTTRQVSDATFKAVVDKFGERGAVDLIAVQGYYNFVSMVLNVDKYPLPDGVAPPLK
ncbi:MAG TPA: carboxymuconolactone decarboxylase family protein [Bryobacteraceae bacterium]|jgi:4-carboxymuconolactone decarboxylase|nr:carboxymuconolactone decarboxylase family protein [Bryobacteraceae bacterium]